MAVLSLVGITGMYLRQVRQIGVLGLIGYLLLAVGYLAHAEHRGRSAVFVLPTLAPELARLRQRRPRRGHQRHPDRRHRPVADRSTGSPASPTSLGGLLFGIALFRAGVLARWAAALLSVGAVATIATLLLPQVNQRLFAIPVGIALIGLGYSLWREQRTAAAEPVASSVELAARPGRRPVTLHRDARPTRSARPTGWVPFALVALVVIPAVAGSLRLVELAGGPLLLPANPRMTASPAAGGRAHHLRRRRTPCSAPSSSPPRLRRRRPRWHRAAGRVLVVLGLAVALSALWMTLFYPRQPGTGELAYLFRLAFGSGLAASIVLGFSAIRRGDVTTPPGLDDPRLRPRPGAPAPRCSPWASAARCSAPAVLITDLSLGAGWVINLAVAEYVIRRWAARPAPLAIAPVGAS